MIVVTNIVAVIVSLNGSWWTQQRNMQYANHGNKSFPKAAENQWTCPELYFVLVLRFRSYFINVSVVYIFEGLESSIHQVSCLKIWMCSKEIIGHYYVAFSVSYLCFTEAKRE